jgi:hypothetical protein
MKHSPTVTAIEYIMRCWLADTDVTIFCGNWGNGGIMELLPQGGASLSAPKYDPPFEGLRELRLANGAHHVHLDLGRLTRACYVIAPSVCYGFRPSFELRLCAAGANPSESFGIGLSVARPYIQGRVREQAVQRYLTRAALHCRQFAHATSFVRSSVPVPEEARDAWTLVDQRLSDVGLQPPGQEPQ